MNSCTELKAVVIMVWGLEKDQRKLQGVPEVFCVWSGWWLGGCVCGYMEIYKYMKYIYISKVIVLCAYDQC